MESLCEHCGQPMNIDAPFCPKCMRKQTKDPLLRPKCDHCGAFYSDNDIICPSCGLPIETILASTVGVKILIQQAFVRVAVLNSKPNVLNVELSYWMTA
jgi:predicted amidophosphoribosyltransferase